MAQEEGKKEKKEVVPVQKGEVVRRGEVDRMVDRFDQMMAEMWARPFSGLFPSFPSLLRPSRALLGEPLTLRVPAVDLYEGKEEVVLKAEVPGLSKEDIKIDLTDSMVTISGEKKKEEEVKEEAYTYSERSYGSFSRSLQLPCAVKADKAKATFKNGILEVKLPKTEDAKKRHVTVKID
ncbi:MAG: Hsp20/alpha crystallin family protein [Nitrospirota bacterium]|nr:Hsp20/alpha crystallin family protein [Nitrospirota bacterium]